MKNIEAIILKAPKQVLYYFTQSAEVKDVLGMARATLIEYVISIDEEVKNVLFKLYKTSEGFWYDPVDEDDKNSISIKFAVKAAIDLKEREVSK
jgi:hypothetical protein